VRNVEKELDVVNSRLRDLDVQLKIVNSDHDSREPLRRFREKFANALVILRVDEPPEIEKWKLPARPHNSGSRNARALIAYYLALWQSMSTNEDVVAPIVIDSPNQGAQDKMNLKGMLGALASQAPKNAQVILTHEDLPDTFLADKVVNLADSKKLLSSEDFIQIGPQLFDFVERARASLAGLKEAVHGDDDVEIDEHDSDEA
jgi:hypothetical protein